MSAALFAANARKIKKEREQYLKEHPESLLKESLSRAEVSDGQLEKTARERTSGVKSENSWIVGGLSAAVGSLYALGALAAGFSAGAIVLPAVAGVGLAAGAAYVLTDEKKAFTESLSSLREMRAAAAKKACGYGDNPEGAGKLANWRESREKACALAAQEAVPAKPSGERAM